MLSGMWGLGVFGGLDLFLLGSYSAVSRWKPIYHVLRKVGLMVACNLDLVLELRSLCL